MTVDAFELATDLNQHGQGHLLDQIDQLSDDQRSQYLERLAMVDWAELTHSAAALDPAAAQPSRVMTLAQRLDNQAKLLDLGEQAYAKGAVAVLMVAGGQGTRLGFAGPKGCFEIGVHSGKSIYQIQAEKVVSLSRRINQAVPLLVMTSPATDAETRAFFAVHENFGLADGQLRIFQQGTVPTLDCDGRALLEAPGKLLENPDGHGGCFTALQRSGMLQDLIAAGIHQLVYIQVDNVLAPVDDPELVGLAIAEHADVITKVLPKADPDERVGHFVSINGHDHIVEYTELNAEQVRMTSPNGEPIFHWGSPAMHCWSVDFLQRLHSAGYVPPLHRSRKKVSAWRDGAAVSLDAYKNERFIFDLLPQAETSIGLEVDRALEFAPVKNAEGTDSPATAQALSDAAWRHWLQAAGVSVDDHAELIEISPLYAATARQFSARWDGRLQTVQGAFYLEDDTVIN